jgi:hypothetical protein
VHRSIHRRAALALAAGALTAAVPAAASAQETAVPAAPAAVADTQHARPEAPVLGGLPAYAPINPVVSSRTMLYFQPYVPAPAPGGRRWRATVDLDYASTIEANYLPGAAGLLDSELLRLGLGLTYELGPSAFALAELTVNGAYDGFLDGFLDWYHDLIGIRMPEREMRPRDAFAYEITTPNGETVSRRNAGAFLGDLRLGLGLRHGAHFQTLLTATLPTSTGPAGYGRGVPTVGVVETARAPLGRRFVYEGSIGVGVAPRHGDLAEYQRPVFLSASSGVRARVVGRQTVFANFYYGSPAYEGTTLPSLDQRELSLDFGWMYRTRGGTEWKVGMTEDMEPSGPGIDLIFRFGRSF